MSDPDNTQDLAPSGSQDDERLAKERRIQRWENEGGASRAAALKAKARALISGVTQANEGRFGAGASRRTITQDEQDRLAHRHDRR